MKVLEAIKRDFPAGGIYGNDEVTHHIKTKV